MQGQVFDLSRFRRCVWDGPFGLSFGFMNTTTSFNFPATSPPYAIAVSNGTTPLNVTMYVPTPAVGIMWCHELINLGTGAGTLPSRDLAAAILQSGPSVLVRERRLSGTRQQQLRIG